MNQANQVTASSQTLAQVDPTKTYHPGLFSRMRNEFVSDVSMIRAKWHKGEKLDAVEDSLIITDKVAYNAVVKPIVANSWNTTKSIATGVEHNILPTVNKELLLFGGLGLVAAIVVLKGMKEADKIISDII